MSKKNTQAMINEVKGYLFEYLFGLELAKKSGIESDYLSNIGDEYMSMLSIHERFLLINEPQLLSSLQSFSQACSASVFKGLGTVTKIELVGKGSLNKNEGDLKLFFKDNKWIWVSLKLCRENSFVNTKSGGVGSFIEKYLSSANSEGLQKDFDSYHELAFSTFKAELFEYYDFDEQETDFSLWIEQGLPTRPGDLPKDLKPVTKRYYSSLKNKMFEIFNHNNFSKNDLLRICGFSSLEMLQVVCLYKDDYVFSKTHIVDPTELLSGDIVYENSEPNSFFTIIVGDRKIQIRLKPMKEFIQKSLKVNCSLYFK